MDWEQYTSESTEVLVELISRKKEQGFELSAQTAFECFCYRFQKDLITKCRNLCSKWDVGYEIADEAALKTFSRFWKYPKFDKQKCKTDIDTCCKFYLYRIASRILADMLAMKNQHSPYDGNEELQLEFPNWANSDIDDTAREVLLERSKQIEAILDSLGRKHKIIYLTYKAYETGGKKLPRHLLKKLRETLKITQNTVRFYKNEAFEAIETFLDTHAKK